MDFFKYFFCVLFCCHLCFKGHGQTGADQFKQQADSLYQLEELDEAFRLYEKARLSFWEMGRWTEAVGCATEAGYVLFDKRAAKQAVAYLAGLLPAFEERQAGIDPEKFAAFRICLALNCRRDENFTEALRHYDAAINIFQANRINHKLASYALKNAAQIHARRLNYPALFQYLESALRADSLGTYRDEIYGHLGSYFNAVHTHQKALEYADLGTTPNTGPDDQLLLNSVRSEAHFRLGNYREAERWARQNIRLLAKEEPDASPWAELKNLADILAAQGKFAEAEKNYLSAIGHVRKEYGPKSREIAKVEAETGYFYFQNKKYDAALAHYQRALIQVFPRFQSTNVADNPPVADIYTESWIMTTSARKAQALRAKYSLTNNMADLENAAACYDLSMAAIEELNLSYGSDNAKIYLGDYTFNYAEGAIEAYFQLYRANPNRQYLDKIFAIMERSKANVLSEAIQKNQALILANIPADLLEKERNLRLELADLNTSIKREELYGEEADEAFLADLRQRIALRQREHESLLAELKKQYPAYRTFSEKKPAPALAAVQAYLAPQGRYMLAYFTGDENIFLLKIGGSSAEVYQWKRTDLWDASLADFQDYFRNSTAIVNDPQGYFATAARLYHQLFPFDTLPEKVIIVPDGQLNFIPFSALVAQEPETVDFGMADFLVKSHHIHYAYSAGLLMDAAKPTNKGLLLKVSPVFANRERGLATLAGEPETSLPFRGFTHLHGAEATLSAFVEMASQCQLIELFTHAGADENDFAPRIEFIDTSLYLPGLYALHIPAGLVILNACETGLGKFEKGEGVMSLARGFAYSGAADLVASLWKVNEGSTSAITGYFYEFLKAGNSKSGALRAAKLRYLEEVTGDAKRSPYYWAGFVSIGPDHPMVFQKQKPPLWWTLPALGCLALVWVWRKRKKNQ